MRFFGLASAREDESNHGDRSTTESEPAPPTPPRDVRALLEVTKSRDRGNLALQRKLSPPCEGGVWGGGGGPPALRRSRPPKWPNREVRALSKPNGGSGEHIGYLSASLSPALRRACPEHAEGGFRGTHRASQRLTFPPPRARARDLADSHGASARASWLFVLLRASQKMVINGNK